MTARFFSAESWRMRWNARCDCTADPPGELISSATARARGHANARSSGFATEASVRPGRSGVEKPITPLSRTTGTVGVSPRKRRGSTGFRKFAVRSSNPGSAIVRTYGFVARGSRLQGERSTVTQDRFSLGARFAGRVIERQGRQENQRRGAALDGAHQDADGGG